MLLIRSSFFFYCYLDHRDLHSFPTRRSSDLAWIDYLLQRQPAHQSHRRVRGELPPLRIRQEGERSEVVHHVSGAGVGDRRSEEHTSELQSRFDLVCRLLLEKKNNKNTRIHIT